MKTQIDIKSALVGLAFGVAVTLCIAAASGSGSVGRYQIAASNEHGLVLDTATGKVWSYFLGSRGGSANQSFFEPKLSQEK
jgi:hypothetical protein